MTRESVERLARWRWYPGAPKSRYRARDLARLRLEREAREKEREQLVREAALELAEWIGFRGGLLNARGEYGEPHTLLDPLERFLIAGYTRPEHVLGDYLRRLAGVQKKSGRTVWQEIRKRSRAPSEYPFERRSALQRCAGRMIAGV